VSYVKKFLTITLTISLALAFFGAVSAQTYSIGILKGDRFTYDYVLFWNSTNPSATPDNFFLELNQTKQVQISIDNVSGSIVNTAVTKEFKNGTQTTETGYVDVANGVINSQFGYLLYCSNLKEGEQLYPLGGHQKIDSTYLKSYSTGQRETNRFILQAQGATTEIDFDKIKGVAVDYYQTTETPSDGGIITIKEYITNTNSDVWATATTPPTSTPTTVSSATATPTHTSTQSPSTGATNTPKPTNSGTKTTTASPTSTVEAPLNTPGVLIIGGILLVVVVLALAAALMLKKRRPRKEKKASASEEDFDLSGWNMK
jgi:hypothetical protein